MTTLVETPTRIAARASTQYFYFYMALSCTAVAFLGFAFDYLPHRPQDSTERYLDTRAYPSPVLNVVLLGQNYHLVHHAWVTVPWFRYRAAFDGARADLEAVGARTTRGAHRRPLPAPSVAG